MGRFFMTQNKGGYMELNKASIGESGKLIRKTLFKMYPGAAIYGLLFNVMLIIDSVIAGSNLGPDGVAAVAIGIPAYGVLLALINALIHGTSLRMVWAKGSADQEGFHRVFCGGFTFIAITGLCFSILQELFDSLNEAHICPFCLCHI